MWLLRKTTNDEKLLQILEAKYEENKKNPGKMSGMMAPIWIAMFNFVPNAKYEENKKNPGKMSGMMARMQALQEMQQKQMEMRQQQMNQRRK